MQKYDLRRPEAEGGGFEEEVHAAEERLRLAMEAMGMGTWDLDLTTGAMVWDARMRALFELSADAPLDFPSVLARVHPGERFP